MLGALLGDERVQVDGAGRSALGPTKEEAALLEIPTSLPVLEIVRVGTSGSDGKPVEVTEYVVASDRVETVHVLHRDESAQDPWPDDTETTDDRETAGEL